MKPNTPAVLQPPTIYFPEKRYMGIVTFTCSIFVLYLASGLIRGYCFPNPASPAALFAAVQAASEVFVQLTPTGVGTSGASDYEGYIFPSSSYGGTTFTSVLTELPQREVFYYLVDNRGAYVTKLSDEEGYEGCLPPSAVPPLSALWSNALDGNYQAYDISNNTRALPACSIWWHTTFAGESYLFCHNASNIYISSSDLLITLNLQPVVPFEQHSLYPPFESNLPHLLECEESTIAVIPIVKDVRRLQEEPFDSTCSTCSLNAKKKCLFIHGAGTKIHEDHLLDAYEVYWGTDIHEVVLPCCETIKFVRYDTFNTPWTNSTLQENICSAMTTLSDAIEGEAMEDLMIISHSMGGLVVSLALESLKCTLGEESRWISLQSPMFGSPATLALNQFCSSYKTRYLTTLLGWLGMCPATSSLTAMYPMGSSEAQELELDAQYTRAQIFFNDRVNAVLCGTSATGLLSSESSQLQLIGSYVDYDDQENDGMVPLDSCMGTLNPELFHNSYTSRYYAAGINHADGTFRHGDGYWGADRKPLKWLRCLF